jgi:hypothetical protein
MRRLPAVLSSCLILAAVVACASAGGTGASGTSGARVKSNPDVITRAEIDSGNFRDAYDVVQRLRPTWFTKARATSSGSLSGTQVTGGSGGMSGVQPTSSGGGLVVYLDNTRMGGPEALRDLPATSVSSLQYMDAATATAKLPGIGSSIVTGAIVATSRTGH